MLRLILALTFLTACPPNGNDTTEGSSGGEGSTSATTIGDSFSSGEVVGTTTSPAVTTGDDGTTDMGSTSDATSGSGTSGLSGGVGLDCETIPQVAATRGGLSTHCDQHPWTDTCPSSFVMCSDVVIAMLETPACEALDWCDYVACAKAMESAACGNVPAACAELVACLG